MKLKIIFIFEVRKMQRNYHTKQSDIILDCLKEMQDNAVSAEEIESILKEQGSPVGKTTIYRHLLKYEKDGIVRKLTPPSAKSALFQMTKNNCHEHLHLRCTKCGKILHLECKFMNMLDKHIKQHHGFSADYNSSVIYGICDKCAEEES